MRRPRPIREFCECGAGIHLVGLDDDADVAILELWRAQHVGHGHDERVSAGEARDIRLSKNRRQASRHGRKYRN